MSRLFLRFDSSPTMADSHVQWLARDDDGAVQAQGIARTDQLAEQAELAPWLGDSSGIAVFVPMAEALALSCKIPGRNVEQMRRAAPYAVEEFITDDISDMHVACATVVRNEPVRCLVAPRDTIHAYLETLAAAGITPSYMTADAMALPAQRNSVTALYEGQGTVLLRTFEQAACVDEPNLDATLAAIRYEMEDEEEPAMLVVNAAGAHARRPLAFMSSLVEQVQVDGSSLDYLASVFDEHQAINLLQGDFAVKRRGAGAWKRWRSVAAAVGAWGAIALVLLAARSFWADMRADALRRSAEQLYKDIYQVERVPGNPAIRMRSRMGQTPVQATGFHHLLANLGLSLQDIPGAYELERLTYNDRSGLGADVIVPGYETLATLQDALAERGFVLDVASAEQQDQRTRATLRVVAE